MVIYDYLEQLGKWQKAEGLSAVQYINRRKKWRPLLSEAKHNLGHCAKKVRVYLIVLNKTCVHD